MSRRTASVSAIALTALFAALIGAFVYGRWTRVHLLPSALRYIPPEANVLVGVGSIASVWDGMDFHFGRVIRETERKGALTQLFAALGESLQTGQKADLVCRYGIDIDRGVLAGSSLEIGNTRDALERAFERVGEGRLSTLVIPVANDPSVVDKYCNSGAPVRLRPKASGTTDGQSCPGLPEGKGRTSTEEKLVRFLCSEEYTPVLLKDQIKAGQYACDASVLLAARGADASWIVSDHAYDLGGRWLVFPQPDTAVLSGSCEFLDRGLAEQDRNLSYARADDSLFAAVRYQLRRPLLSGAGALVFVRDVSADFAPVATAAAALNLVPDAVLGDVRVRTPGMNTHIVGQILASVSGEQPWREFSGAEDAATLVLRDFSLPRYRDFANNNRDVAEALEKFLGGILEPARRLRHLEQIVVSGIDYKDGLPLLVLGMWGDRKELELLVFDTQRRLRESRDDAILRGVLRDHPAPQTEGSPSLNEILQAADLGDDAVAFARFHLAGADLKHLPLTLDDFNRVDYTATYRDHQIRYLEPRVTVADLKYRLPEVDAEEGQILLENRYRLASTITGNILWVSTGEQHLRAIIDRFSGDNEHVFVPDVKSDHHANKLRVLVSVGNLIKKGMLSGESDMESLVNTLLLDFRYHREISVSLQTTGNGSELRLSFAAHGPVAGSAPPGAASKVDDVSR